MIGGSTNESRFSPLTSTAGTCAAWYREVGTVSSWTDKSGNARHAVQGTGSKQPTIGSVGAFSTYVFDGANDVLSVAFTLVQPVTIFTVARWLTGTAGTICDGPTGNAGRLFRTSSGSLACHSGTQIGPFAGDDQKWQCFTQLLNGASSYIRMHRAQQGTASMAANPAGVVLGTFGDGASDPGNCAIVEHIVYSSALSVADVAAVEAYLTQRYSL